MLRFDPNNIQEFTKRLLGEANRTIWLFSVMGGMVGALCGDIWLSRMVERMSNTNVSGMEAAAVATGIVAGALLGFALGTQRALTLRFTAYMALCQLEIERNTRATRMTNAATAQTQVDPAKVAAMQVERPKLPVKR